MSSIGNISYDINKIDTKKGVKDNYEIQLVIPDFGWFNNVYFNIKDKDKFKSFPLKYDKMENGKIFFKSNVQLEKRSKYDFCFSYCINNNLRYINKNGEPVSSIHFDEMMELVNDEKDLEYKLEPIEKTANGMKYKISITLPDLGYYHGVYFNVKKFDYVYNKRLEYIQPKDKPKDDKMRFEAEIELSTSAIYHNYFSVNLDGKTYYITKDNEFVDTIYLDQMNKMSVNFDAPDWAKGKIMYHIFVDRFNRGSKEKMKPMKNRNCYESFDDELKLGPDKDGIWNNDFYGGDLKGITDKLDYIKSLGASIIYLSPIVMSQSNHRYDAGDYRYVDPYAGCNEDLKELCDKAHEKGMKVILDAVFNHTGNDSKYFNEFGTYNTVGASQSNESPYSSFYKKHIGPDGKTYYNFWWGMPNLPECDGSSLSWKKYITGKGGVIDGWFDLGIDGLRLDVADELTDEYLELIREAVKRNKPDGFILGEVWKNPMRMGRSYIDSGKSMDSVMNYNFEDALVRYFKDADVGKLAYTIKDILTEYPDDTIFTAMNFTSTHDITRAINIFGSEDFKKYGEWRWNIYDESIDYCSKYKLSKEQYEHGKKVYKAFIFALASFPGILSIFYGDEAGIEGMGNLANRKPYPWGKEDMDLVNFFKYIGNYRNKEPFLETAKVNILDINNDILLFEREKNNEKIMTAVNRTNDFQDFYVPSEYRKEKNKIYTLNKSRSGILTPYGGVNIKTTR